MFHRFWYHPLMTTGLLLLWWSRPATCWLSPTKHARLPNNNINTHGLQQQHIMPTKPPFTNHNSMVKNNMSTTLHASLPNYTMGRINNIGLHVLFWATTTVACRYLLPPLQRLLLPTSTPIYQKLHQFLTDHHHEQFQALSVTCWAVHVLGQALLSLCALQVLLPSTLPTLRAFGIVTAINAAGGGLLLGSHSLIDRHAALEKLLDFTGTRVVRAATMATGPSLLWPHQVGPISVAALLLSATGCVTFSNPPGRVLGLASVVLQLVTRGFSVPYKLAVASMLLAIPRLPESQYDRGHTVVAGTISVPYLVLWLAGS